jgi:hypothetical protein
MEQDLRPGDFLVYQLEAGFALLRLLAVDADQVWHVTAYSDFFPNVDSAEEAIANGDVRVAEPHLALTQRAFESTQVARIANQPVNDNADTAALNTWRSDPNRQVSDRSIRLMLGLR